MRLVSQANPATRQYRPAHNGYPPSSSTAPYLDSPQPMDPFFDDDDENIVDSAFSRPVAMQSQESGLPLAHNAAPPAGSHPSKPSLGDGVPQGWNFDDDDFQHPDQTPFPRSEQYPKEPSSSPTRKWKWEWKWPWRKEKVMAGERIIMLNNSSGNVDFCSNSVSTSKYNLVSFAPKFLFGMPVLLFLFVSLHCMFSEQFSKYANLFFLFTACIQQIPDVSPTNKYTTIVPLAVVLLASAFKEVQEDLVSCDFGCLVFLSLASDRNDISQMLNLAHGMPRSSRISRHSWIKSGKTYTSGMWYDWRVTISSLQT
jgi:phospholipid-transporting ATPase